MILALASVGFAAAICQATPVEKTLSPEKLKILPSLYTNAKAFKCKEIGRELAIVSNPIRSAEICIFNELNFGGHGDTDALRHSVSRKAVALVNNNGTCPTVSFGARDYPGPNWTFALRGIQPKDALQIKAIVATNGIAILDKETAKRKEELPDIPYGTRALAAFSIAVTERNNCRDRISPEKDIAFETCFDATVYNDLVKGWSMYFAKKIDGTYSFVASARIVY
jgi:hypothetical protein